MHYEDIKNNYYFYSQVSYDLMAETRFNKQKSRGPIKFEFQINNKEKVLV